MSSKNYQAYNIWYAIVVVCTSYVSVIIPIDIVFNIRLELTIISDYIITLIFLMDFVVNVYRYREIKKTPNYQEGYKGAFYLQGLLLADLLAAIPFGLFFHPSYFRLIRIFKIFRIINLFEFYRKKQIKFAGLITFMVFIFWMLHIIHWLGCGWIGLRGLEPDSDLITHYINAVYWAVTTLTTVGYGDILPVNNSQKIYSMFVQVMGFGVFGFLIGTIASILMKKDPAKSKYLENIDNLASLMHYRKIPLQLKNRIVDFYTYMWKKRLGYDETVFLESLPENLQTEVALHLKKEVIEKISLFKNATNEFKREISLLLKPIFLTPGDYIFKAGDQGEEMYFVVNGKLNTLTHKEDRILTTLKSGDFFGEIALFKNKNRTATVKAISYCDIYVLDKKAFDKVLTKYPEIGIKIQDQVEIRESRYMV